MNISDMNGSFQADIGSEKWVTKQIYEYLSREYGYDRVKSGEYDVHDESAIIDIVVLEDKSIEVEPDNVEIAVECKGKKDFRKGLQQAKNANRGSQDVYLACFDPPEKIINIVHSSSIDIIWVDKHNIYAVSDDSKRDRKSRTFNKQDSRLASLKDQAFRNISKEQLLDIIIGKVHDTSTNNITKLYNEIRLAKGMKTVKQPTVRRTLNDSDKFEGEIIDSSGLGSKKIWSKQD